jgi:FAD:protein FMN transferase
VVFWRHRLTTRFSERIEMKASSFEGIGVLNEIVVGEDSALDEATRIARHEVGALDLACSRFREDSELALVNRAAGRASRIGPLLFDAIETALTTAGETDGLVDPTVGASMRGIGYDRSFAIVVRRGGSPRFSFVAAAGWQNVKLDHEQRTVTIPRGCELDLGATAKAFAADRIAFRIAAATGSDALVSLGGDIAVCGSPPEGWPVLVGDSHRQPTASGQTVAVRDGGLATSSTTVRRWSTAGIEMHHVVDPETGAPARGPWRTVSVAAPTCLDANVAATAAIVLGDSALRWLEARGLAARLVTNDGDVVGTGGWPTHSRFTGTSLEFSGESQEQAAP